MTNLSEKKGGGLIYNPPRMLFDGSTGYFSDTTVTVSGNKVTVFAQVKIPPFTNGGVADERYICHPVAGSFHRGSLLVYASDAATTDWRNKVFFLVRNSSNVTICGLISTQDICDGEVHTIFAQFDGDAGTAVFKVDGADADNTGATSRVAPTTGTISTTSPAMYVGTNSGASRFTSMEIGTFGYDDSASAVWSDYMDQYGNPKQTDFSGWLFGHFAGKMDENEGTAEAMTKNGTITLVDPGPCPHIGLPTIGDAENWHIKSAKKAWVNGVEKTGSAYTPAMMRFDGSTGYYNKLTGVTTSGNAITAVGMFKCAATAAGDQRVLTVNNGTHARLVVQVKESDHGLAPNRLQFLSYSNAGALILNRAVDVVVADDQVHSFFIDFNADTATTVIYIDGLNADSVGYAINSISSGTLANGASSQFWIGANFGPTLFLDGEIGFIGFRDVTGLNPLDFFNADGSCKPLDESAWSEWGLTQPPFWNPHGDMENNLGSAGAMTKNGTIVVGDGGAM